MIKLKNKSKILSIPDQWNELNPVQFVQVLQLCNRVVSGELDMLDFRLFLFKLLTNYKPARFTMPRHKEQIESNIFNLAMMLKFPIVPQYDNPELLEVLTGDLREKLKTCFPFDVYEVDYLQQLEMIADQLNWRPVLNIDFGRNLLPVITAGKLEFYGPVFSMLENGSFETNITVGEYFDALGELQLFDSSNNELYLNRFVGTIYRRNRASAYDPEHTAAALPYMAKVAPEVKQALVLLWAWYSKVIQQHHLYSVFFMGGDETNSGNPLGLSATLFALSSDGYGTRDEIRRWPVTDFFNSLYYRLSSTVDQLRRQGLDDIKISKELELSLSTLEKL